jgi:hypothetical protein
MWEQLRRFRKLPPHTRALFVRAAFFLPLLTWRLRHQGFGATREWLQLRSRKPIARSANEMEQLIGSVERAVRAAARHGFGRPTCLQRSLTMWWLLEREGIPADLRIGVRKQAERFEAHAWVECAGRALGEPDAQHEHYAAFDAEFSRFMAERS